MKTIVVGAGAIGGTVAVLLKNAGYDVSLMCHSASSKELIEKNGFDLRGAKGEYHVKFPCFCSVSEVGDTKFDVCVIATKYQHMEESAKSILPIISDDALVVGMQNGICTQELGEIVGRNRVCGCMIGFGATRNSPNDVTMTSKGLFYLGMLDGQCPPKLSAFAEMLSKVLPTKISMDIKREQYSKLIINSCINATAAITGKTLGIIVDDRRARDLFLNIAREGIAVAKAMNIKVPKYGAILEYRMLDLGNNKPYNSLCKAAVWVVGKSYSNVKPSTLQSLEKGEKTEIDIFNGYFSTNGAALGISTPVNSKIVEMVHEIEDGKREMSMDNLNEF